MALVPNDYELDFLRNCSKEELEPLVGILLGTDKEGNIKSSGRITSELQKADAFKEYFPDHTKYVDEIIEEIQKYGGRTLLNLILKRGVSYHKVLCDVAKNMKVKFKRTQHTKTIEKLLLEKVFKITWEKLPEEDRRKLIDTLGKKTGIKCGVKANILVLLLRAGGVRAYWLVWSLLDAICIIVLGRSLWQLPTVWIALNRVYAVIAGPIGIAISTLWAIWDISGPAYRITIKACVYIACLRILKENKKFLESKKSVKEVKKPVRALKKRVKAK